MRRTLLMSTFLGAATLVAASVASSTSAQAQSPLCPTSNGATGGIASFGGACTNSPSANSATTGAFSGAALASQALTDLSQSSSDQVTQTTNNAMRDRRETEQQRCSAGFTRRNGECEPTRVRETTERRATTSTRRVARMVPVKMKNGKTRMVRRTESVTETSEAPVRERRIARMVPVKMKNGKTRMVRRMEREPVETVEVAEPLNPTSNLIVEMNPRYGAWAQAFGDYETRNGSTNGTLVYSSTGGPGGILSPFPAIISATSHTTTGGVTGGIDITTRGIVSPDDGIIAGLSGGYTDSEVRIRTTITQLPATATYAVGGTVAVPGITGVNAYRAHLSGPSIGGYATFFNGPFSLDVAARADFFDVNIGFDDNLAFVGEVGSPNVNGLGAVLIPFSGNGNTHSVQTTLTGNMNYRFALTGSYWIEPTVGMQYTRQNYASNAYLLGLGNGDVLRAQGGARIGTSFQYGSMVITPVLTGLVYDDVVVQGGIIETGGFQPSSVVLNDQGKVRGEGILAINADFGGGWSSSIQGDVRGGQGLFGAGGKATIRYRW